MYFKVDIFKLISIALAIFFLVASNYKFSFASGLSNLSDQLSRIKVSTPSNHTIKFTTFSGVGAGETVEITMPNGFSIPTSLDYTDLDLADDGVDLDLDATCSGTTWGATKSGQNIIITSCTGAIVGGSEVSVEIGTNATHQTAGDQQIINCSQTDIYPKIQIGGTMADNGEISIQIVTQDQISVTGVLIPTLSFVLNTAPLDFGLVTPSAIGGAGPNNMVLATNSPLGYTITVRDLGNGSNAGMWNSAKGHLISSTAGLLYAGAEGYGGQCERVSGAGSCHANFNFSGNNVGSFTLTNKTFASYGAKPSGAENFLITVYMAITGNTPSGAYHDQLTFIATAIY
jgi:hypothetical protein